MKRLASIYVLLALATNALPAFAQAIQYRNSGWDLFPQSRNRVWTPGNTTGYFEGEAIPFRGDITVGAGSEPIITSIRYDNFLDSGPGKGKGFHAIDFLENPFALDSNIPDRARPVEYPSDAPDSDDGPFVCWGGTIEVLEGPVESDASGPERELRYKLKVTPAATEDGLATILGGRRGVVIGFATHLALSERCRTDRRNRTTCRVYGASFWPGSRIHLCLDRPAFVSASDDSRRIAAKCVPIPVAFNPVRVKEFFLRIPETEWDAVQETNAGRDPANPWLFAALWSRDAGETWVCEPLNESGPGRPEGIWDYFDTRCPDDTDMVVLKGMESIQCPSTVYWTFGLIEEEKCSNDDVSPADLLRPEDGGVPFCEGAGGLGPYSGILGPEEIPCGDTPFVNFCEPPLEKKFKVEIEACDCTDAMVTVNYRISHRPDEGRADETGSLRLSDPDGDCIFEGSLSPVHQGDTLEWQALAESPLFPDAMSEQKTETVCDVVDWSRLNDALIRGIEKKWRLKVDNHCAPDPAVKSARLVYYRTDAAGQRVGPDVERELEETSSGIWETPFEELCLAYLVYKYEVTLANDTRRDTGFLGGDPADCFEPPVDGSGCGVPFRGNNPEAICTDVGSRVDPGCLEIPVVKKFCATVSSMPMDWTVSARWKYCDATQYNEVPLNLETDTGRWCGEEEIDIRDNLAHPTDIGRGYDCIEVDFVLRDETGAVAQVFGEQRDDELCGLERTNIADLPFAFPRTIGYWGTWANHLRNNPDDHFSLADMVTITRWVNDNEVCDSSSRIWTYLETPDCNAADDPGIYRLRISNGKRVTVNDIHKWLLEEQSNDTKVGQLRAQSLGTWLNVAAAELREVSTRSGNPVGVPLMTSVFLSKLTGYNDPSLNPVANLGTTATVKDLLCELDAAATCNPDNPWAAWTPNQRSFMAAVFEGINTGQLLEP